MENITNEEAERKETIKKVGFRLIILWDIIMILIAVANVTLIAFDLTYLWFRPFYFKNFPLITEKFDPVLGIEPHTTTRKFIEKADNYFSIVKAVQPNLPFIELQKQNELIKQEKTELSELYNNMVKENPFVMSGQVGNLEYIKDILRKKYVNEKLLKDNSEEAKEELKDPSSKKAFAWFLELTPETFESRFTLYNTDIKPYITVNYYRKYALSGNFVDHFYLLDFPFLVFFSLEFLIRWIIAVNRKQYIAWFLFPIYNWYDVLGLLPVRELRFFRLIRIVSIFIRIHKTEFGERGDDIVTRTIKYYSNIIKEEVSDMVTIKILSEAQEEVKSGNSTDILVKAIEENRAEIKKVVISNVTRNMNPNNETNVILRKFIADIALDALKSLPTSKIIPEATLNLVAKNFTDSLFIGSYKVLAASPNAAVNSALNKDPLVGKILDLGIDIFIQESKNEEIQKLSTNITVDVLENVKKSVGVKKWLDKKI